MDAAKKAWDETPDAKPMLKAARKKAYDVARDVYELSSSAKKKIFETKQAAFAALPKPAESKPFKAIAAAVEGLVDEVKQRQTAVDALEQALAPLVAFHARHPGQKLLELNKGNFDLDLAALSKGGSLPVDFEVRWLEDTRRVKGELSFSDLAAAMHAVAQTLVPKLP
jgi:hypothetical protein